MSDARPLTPAQPSSSTPINTSVIEPAFYPPTTRPIVTPASPTAPVAPQPVSPPSSDLQIFSLASLYTKTNPPDQKPATIPTETTSSQPIITSPNHIPLNGKQRWLLIMNFVMLALFLFHGVRGLWNSLRFIYIEFPLFEQITFEQGLPQEQLVQLMIKMTIILVITGLNLLLAVHLVTFETITEKRSRFFFSVLLFIFSFVLTQYALGINYLS